MTVDSTVLPASPPRVTSPPLEAQLFFGAVPGGLKFGSTPRLDLYAPGGGKGVVASVSVHSVEGQAQALGRTEGGEEKQLSYT